MIEKDRLILAADAVGEAAHAMVAISANLLAGACAVDIVTIEADLWCMRQALTSAIVSWREAVPGITNDGAQND